MTNEVEIHALRWVDDHDVAGLNPVIVQRSLRRLWQAHHDSYAPHDLLAGDMPTTDRHIVPLLYRLHRQTTTIAQTELDRLNLSA